MGGEAGHMVVVSWGWRGRVKGSGVVLVGQGRASGWLALRKLQTRKSNLVMAKAHLFGG